MLNFRPATDRDAALCRQAGAVFVWLTAAAGIFLLWRTVTTPVHIIMAAMLILLPLLARSSARRAERITARIIGGVMWGLALLFLAQTVSTVSVGWSIASPALAVSLCVIGGNLLCAWTPGIYTLAVHGNRYDRVVACFCQTLLAGIAAIGAFTGAREQVVWLWDHPYARYAFFALAAGAAILVWVAVLTDPSRKQPTP